MKNLIVVISLIIFCNVFCNSTKIEGNGYTIIGNVRHIPGKFVYLRILPPFFLRTAEDYNNKYLDIIDSVLITNDSFKFYSKQPLDETMDASIYFKQNKKLVPLVFSNDKFKTPDFKLENKIITLIGDSINDISISGSEENNIAFKYKSVTPSESFFKIRNHLNNIQDTNNMVLINQLTNQLEMLKKLYFEKIKSIIIDNPNSSVVNGYVLKSSFFLNTNQVNELTNYQNKNMWFTPTGIIIRYSITQKNVLLPGNQFPDIRLTDTSGVFHDLSDIKGKNQTLIIFWASSCIPCREEIPELKSIYELYKNKGLQMISISMDDKLINWKKALQTEKMPWLNLSNLPKTHNEIQVKYQCEAIPMMFLLDRNNTILLARETQLKKIKERVVSKLN